MAGSIADILEDYVNLPILSKSESQMESFGFVLPTDKIIDFLRGEHRAGKVAGFIIEIEMRDKGKGKYGVVRLAPFGSFWTKKASVLAAIKEGDCVSAEVSDYGAGERVKRLKL
jgi:hypothetical protein